MIQTLCNLYACTVAAVWSGVGCAMESNGDVILCADTAVRVEYGCLSLRAVILSGWVGVACAVMIRRAWPFPAGLALGALMSWLRVFALVGLACMRPPLFHALHARCGYAAFAAASLCLIFAVCMYVTAQLKKKESQK
ncbi:MAG: archaeosortase/exosortase family protein [Kiritimatiellia bacterium]|jgi:hypothetical protein|nr:exosortase/archaeosortase family protein [Lentisphaerota bacterium]